MARSSVHFLVILATIQAQLWTMCNMQSCVYRYIKEPGPTSETCNIIGTSVNITCHVGSLIQGGSYQLDIQWYFTQDLQEAGEINQNTVLNKSNPLYTLHSPTYFISNNNYIRHHSLAVSKLNPSTAGYYWCRLMSQPSPSQVVHIQYCPNSVISSCSEPVFLSSPVSTSPRCADIENQNVSIVNAQDLACEEDTTTTSTAAAPKQTTTTEKKENNSTPSTQKNTTTTVSSVDTTSTASQTDQTDPTPFDQKAQTTLTVALATEEQTSSDGQGGEEFPIDIVWLAIGSVLALLLLPVIILLAIIIAMQCKKRRLKLGVGSPTHNDQVDQEASFDLSAQTSKQPDKDKEAEAEPEYAEIPATSNALNITNPLLLSRTSREDHTPFSRKPSVDYEDISISAREHCRSPREPHENVDLGDRSVSSRLEHSASVKRTSTSSASSTHLPAEATNSSETRVVFDEAKYSVVLDPCPLESPHLLNHTPQDGRDSPVAVNVSDESGSTDLGADSSVYDKLEHDVGIRKTSVRGSPLPPLAECFEVKGVFDDSKYSSIDPYRPRPHLPLHMSKSAPQDDHSYEVVDFSTKNRLFSIKGGRKFSYDSSSGGPHTYAAVLPKQARRKGSDVSPVPAAEDRYISENGHVYHILEDSTKLEGGDSSDKTGNAHNGK